MKIIIRLKDTPNNGYSAQTIFEDKDDLVRVCYGNGIQMADMDVCLDDDKNIEVSIVGGPSFRKEVEVIMTPFNVSGGEKWHAKGTIKALRKLAMKHLSSYLNSERLVNVLKEAYDDGFNKGRDDMRNSFRTLLGIDKDTWEDEDTL